MNRLLVFTCFAWCLGPPFAAAEETYIGTFVHYEGAEYESTFIPCGSEEIWTILDSPGQRLLIERATAAEGQEIVVTLVLKVTPIDKAKYPQSHYSGTAEILQIVDADETQESCEGR